jgi:hypothetical protein
MLSAAQLIPPMEVETSVDSIWQQKKNSTHAWLRSSFVSHQINVRLDDQSDIEMPLYEILRDVIPADTQGPLACV